ncbi:liver specific protein 1, putative [Plasmodium sp. gorilla clade G2]|uniref:liver specific protein 1, putative n=1 Tax=Plasmodium sp. gorilla clade G2 TaxID=880535 RepID=UPI000D217CC9|nr:liver specific protein 1, putative [Plasmodium sp. gorilla clade G2]SOV18887.1 liver specific protein 1, putative [Plasmodium sp. gorilla clade G2]
MKLIVLYLVFSLYFFDKKIVCNKKNGKNKSNNHNYFNNTNKHIDKEVIYNLPENDNLFHVLKYLIHEENKNILYDIDASLYTKIEKKEYITKEDLLRTLELIEKKNVDCNDNTKKVKIAKLLIDINDLLRTNYIILDDYKEINKNDLSKNGFLLKLQNSLNKRDMVNFKRVSQDIILRNQYLEKNYKLCSISNDMLIISTPRNLNISDTSIKEIKYPSSINIMNERFCDNVISCNVSNISPLQLNKSIDLYKPLLDLDIKNRIDEYRKKVISYFEDSKSENFYLIRDEFNEIKKKIFLHIHPSKMPEAKPNNDIFKKEDIEGNEIITYVSNKIENKDNIKNKEEYILKSNNNNVIKIASKRTKKVIHIPIKKKKKKLSNDIKVNVNSSTNSDNNIICNDTIDTCTKIESENGNKKNDNVKNTNRIYHIFLKKKNNEKKCDISKQIIYNNNMFKENDVIKPFTHNDNILKKIIIIKDVSREKPTIKEIIHQQPIPVENSELYNISEHIQNKCNCCFYSIPLIHIYHPNGSMHCLSCSQYEKNVNRKCPIYEKYITFNYNDTCLLCVPSSYITNNCFCNLIPSKGIGKKTNDSSRKLNMMPHFSTMIDVYGNKNIDGYNYFENDNDLIVYSNSDEPILKKSHKERPNKKHSHRYKLKCPVGNRPSGIFSGQSISIFPIIGDNINRGDYDNYVYYDEEDEMCYNIMNDDNININDEDDNYEKILYDKDKIVHLNSSSFDAINIKIGGQELNINDRNEENDLLDKESIEYINEINEKEYYDSMEACKDYRYHHAFEESIKNVNNRECYKNIYYSTVHKKEDNMDKKCSHDIESGNENESENESEREGESECENINNNKNNNDEQKNYFLFDLRFIYKTGFFTKRKTIINSYLKTNKIDITYNKEKILYLFKSLFEKTFKDINYQIKESLVHMFPIVQNSEIEGFDLDFGKVKLHYATSINMFKYSVFDLINMKIYFISPDKTYILLEDIIREIREEKENSNNDGSRRKNKIINMYSHEMNITNIECSTENTKTNTTNSESKITTTRENTTVIKEKIDTHEENKKCDNTNKNNNNSNSNNKNNSNDNKRDNDSFEHMDIQKNDSITTNIDCNIIHNNTNDSSNNKRIKYNLNILKFLLKYKDLLSKEDINLISDKNNLVTIDKNDKPNIGNEIIEITIRKDEKRNIENSCIYTNNSVINNIDTNTSESININGGEGINAVIETVDKYLDKYFSVHNMPIYYMENMKISKNIIYVTSDVNSDLDMLKMSILGICNITNKSIDSFNFFLVRKEAELYDPNKCQRIPEHIKNVQDLYNYSKMLDMKIIIAPIYAEDIDIIPKSFDYLFEFYKDKDDKKDVTTNSKENQCQQKENVDKQERNKRENDTTKITLSNMKHNYKMDRNNNNNNNNSNTNNSNNSNIYYYNHKLSLFNDGDSKKTNDDTTNLDDKNYYFFNYDDMKSLILNDPENDENMEYLTEEITVYEDEHIYKEGNLYNSFVIYIDNPFKRINIKNAPILKGYTLNLFINDIMNKMIHIPSTFINTQSFKKGMCVMSLCYCFNYYSLNIYTNNIILLNFDKDVTLYEVIKEFKSRENEYLLIKNKMNEECVDVDNLSNIKSPDTIDLIDSKYIHLEFPLLYIDEHSNFFQDKIILMNVPENLTIYELCKSMKNILNESLISFNLSTINDIKIYTIRGRQWEMVLDNLLVFDLKINYQDIFTILIDNNFLTKNYYELLSNIIIDFRDNNMYIKKLDIYIDYIFQPYTIYNIPIYITPNNLKYILLQYTNTFLSNSLLDEFFFTYNKRHTTINVVPEVRNWEHVDDSDVYIYEENDINDKTKEQKRNISFIYVLNMLSTFYKIKFNSSKLLESVMGELHQLCGKGFNENLWLDIKKSSKNEKDIEIYLENSSKKVLVKNVPLDLLVWKLINIIMRGSFNIPIEDKEKLYNLFMLVPKNKDKIKDKNVDYYFLSIPGYTVEDMLRVFEKKKKPKKKGKEKKSTNDNQNYEIIYDNNSNNFNNSNNNNYNNYDGMRTNYYKILLIKAYPQHLHAIQNNERFNEYLTFNLESLPSVIDFKNPITCLSFYVNYKNENKMTHIINVPENISTDILLKTILSDNFCRWKKLPNEEKIKFSLHLNKKEITNIKDYINNTDIAQLKTFILINNNRRRVHEKYIDLDNTTEIGSNINNISKEELKEIQLYDNVLREILNKNYIDYNNISLSGYTITVYVFDGNNYEPLTIYNVPLNITNKDIINFLLIKANHINIMKLIDEFFLLNEKLYNTYIIKNKNKNMVEQQNVLFIKNLNDEEVFQFNESKFYLVHNPLFNSLDNLFQNIVHKKYDFKSEKMDVHGVSEKFENLTLNILINNDINNINNNNINNNNINNNNINNNNINNNNINNNNINNNNINIIYNNNFSFGKKKFVITVLNIPYNMYITEFLRYSIGYQRKWIYKFLLFYIIKGSEKYILNDGNDIIRHGKTVSEIFQICKSGDLCTLHIDINFNEADNNLENDKSNYEINTKDKEMRKVDVGLDVDVEGNINELVNSLHNDNENRFIVLKELSKKLYAEDYENKKIDMSIICFEYNAGLYERNIFGSSRICNIPKNYTVGDVLRYVKNKIIEDTNINMLYDLELKIIYNDNYIDIPKDMNIEYVINYLFIYTPFIVYPSDDISKYNNIIHLILYNTIIDIKENTFVKKDIPIYLKKGNIFKNVSLKYIPINIREDELLTYILHYLTDNSEVISFIRDITCICIYPLCDSIYIYHQKKQLSLIPSISYHIQLKNIYYISTVQTYENFYNILGHTELNLNKYLHIQNDGNNYKKKEAYNNIYYMNNVDELIHLDVNIIFPSIQKIIRVKNLNVNIKIEELLYKIFGCITNKIYKWGELFTNGVGNKEKINIMNDHIKNNNNNIKSINNMNSCDSNDRMDNKVLKNYLSEEENIITFIFCSHDNSIHDYLTSRMIYLPAIINYETNYITFYSSINGFANNETTFHGFPNYLSPETMLTILQYNFFHIIGKNYLKLYGSLYDNGSDEDIIYNTKDRKKLENTEIYNKSFIAMRGAIKFILRIKNKDKKKKPLDTIQNLINNELNISCESVENEVDMEECNDFLSSLNNSSIFWKNGILGFMANSIVTRDNMNNSLILPYVDFEINEKMFLQNILYHINISPYLYKLFELTHIDKKCNTYKKKLKNSVAHIQCLLSYGFSIYFDLHYDSTFDKYKGFTLGENSFDITQIHSFQNLHEQNFVDLILYNHDDTFITIKNVYRDMTVGTFLNDLSKTRCHILGLTYNQISTYYKLIYEIYNETHEISPHMSIADVYNIVISFSKSSILLKIKKIDMSKDKSHNNNNINSNSNSNNSNSNNSDAIIINSGNVVYSSALPDLYLSPYPPVIDMSQNNFQVNIYMHSKFIQNDYSLREDIVPHITINNVPSNVFIISLKELLKTIFIEHMEKSQTTTFQLNLYDFEVELFILTFNRFNTKFHKTNSNILSNLTISNFYSTYIQGGLFLNIDKIKIDIPNLLNDFIDHFSKVVIDFSHQKIVKQ